jgi:hypothetical protein
MAAQVELGRLLKNTHLLRCAHSSSLRRTQKVRLIPQYSRALHLGMFLTSPGEDHFLKKLLVSTTG